MKKIIYFTIISLLTTTAIKAQQGFGTNNPDKSAVVDIVAANKGALMPRVALTSTTDVTTIANPANALTIFNTATAGSAPDNVIPGFYYWESATGHWVRLNDEEPYNGLALYPNRKVGLGGRLENNTTIAYNNKSLTFLSGNEGSPFLSARSVVFSQDGLKLRYNDGGAYNPSLRDAFLSIQNSRTDATLNLQLGTEYDGIITGIKSIFSFGPFNGEKYAGGQFGAIRDATGGGDNVAQIGIIAKGADYLTSAGISKSIGGYFEAENISTGNIGNYAIYAKATGIRPVALLADSGSVVITELNSSAVAAAGRPVVADANGKLMIGVAAGSVSTNIVSVTSDYTLTDSDYTVVARGTNPITLTLPDPTLYTGRVLILVNHSTLDITLSRSVETGTNPSTGNIADSNQLFANWGNNFTNRQTIQSDGAKWIRIGN